SSPRLRGGFLRRTRGDQASDLARGAARLGEDLAGVLAEQRPAALDARARRAEAQRRAQRAHGAKPRMLEVDEEVARDEVWIVEYRGVVLDLAARDTGRAQDREPVRGRSCRRDLLDEPDELVRVLAPHGPVGEAPIA